MLYFIVNFGGGSGHGKKTWRNVRGILEAEGVPHEYHEAPGIHDMVFWVEHIQKIVRWMFG